MTPEVTTPAGRIRGRHGAVHAFLGIPYAAAPFGPNRFQPPGPPAGWTGVRDCVAFGPIAPQDAELPGAPTWSGADDVLTLNVWAPPVAHRLPVLVWIHGGAYTFGSTAQPGYDGSALAATGLVVVTANYRLGFEGFGHLAGHPDNRGLLDQIAALRWVRENIAAFGGDPGNVTVAGQSAGAGSAACLLLMPQARGLFRRAILHSVPDSYFTTDAAAAITAEITTRLGADPATAAPRDLVAAATAVSGIRQSGSRRQYDPVLFGPVVDGRTLPAAPLSTVHDTTVDLLVCHTTEEYRLFDALDTIKRVDTDAQLRAFAHAMAIPDTVAEHYRTLTSSPREAYLALFGDAIFAAHSTRLAEHHARHGGRAHLARFARRRSGVHAWHCADVPLNFGNLATADFLLGGPPDDHDQALSRRMMRAWRDFARTGDPGWPPVTPAETPVHTWALPGDRLDRAGGEPWRAMR
ncbi:carboxylesterase/lipase family protein [Saccharopolyspora shandongensis]|uniref:carboxylesterase/lipase family protein n=1 Tax=Saccharopolyspora shandongensis TaxID=418495 RepID=UPI003405A595